MLNKKMKIFFLVVVKKCKYVYVQLYLLVVYKKLLANAREWNWENKLIFFLFYALYNSAVECLTLSIFYFSNNIKFKGKNEIR